ncbi:MAG: phosphatidate cytidylyltransferase [Bacillota bacterium]|nr:phosphatidate cytidylyltransferase [Bacillota bacterium]
MLWHRIISAIIGIPIAIYIFYQGGLSFLFALLLLSIIGQREIIRMLISTGVNVLAPVIYSSGIAFIFSAYFLPALFFQGVILAAILFIFFLFVVLFPKITLMDIGSNLLAVFYPGFLFSLLILLRNISELGFTYILLAFLLTWSSDTFAYFVGRAFGKQKLAPSLSPNKTREGAIGGLLGTILISVLFSNFFLDISIYWAILIGACSSLLAQLGDLCESGLKRLANVKDSGNLIPGHGGVLDRFDSILFVGPVLYYLLLIISF